MNEGRLRKPDDARAFDDVGDLFPEHSGASSAPSGETVSGAATSGSANKASSDGGSVAATKTPPELSLEEVAKHRAAKQARVRKRRQKKQGGAGQSGATSDAPAKPKGQSGNGVKRGSALPALRPEIKPDTPALRAERVEAIRRDLVRRRRRKGGTMLLKLWAVVGLPTLMVGYFLWFVASPMYESESSFFVESADGAGAASGGLLSSFIGGGGSNDPVAVQTYVNSRDVLRLLNAEHDWSAHFQSSDLDFRNRLREDATFEEEYAHYRKMVTVSYDPTEGIIEMSVVASDSQTALRFNEAIIGYAENMVDALSDRIRRDAMKDADASVAEAEAKLKAAQLAEAEIRKRQEIFSIEAEVANSMSIVTGMETELETKTARLTNLRRVTAEDDPRVQRLSNQVETLRSQIDRRRASVAGNTQHNKRSLADLNAELTRAQFDVQAAMAIFSSALQAREVARTNAQRQHRYLSRVSEPSLPDEANHPKKIQLLALAFLCFLGFYIVFSLTVSLIREQASI